MRINLKAPTIHAIKILQYMEEQEEKRQGLTLAKEAAASIGVTQSYFMRVIRDLQKGELVKSVQGRNGGFQLTKRADHITLGEVVAIMEESSKPIRDESFRSLQAALATAERVLEEQFSGIMLAELQ